MISTTSGLRMTKCGMASATRRQVVENTLARSPQRHRNGSAPHLFSHDWNAMRGYHYLMRIGHTLNILAQYGAVLIKLVQTLGVRGFIDFVRETMAGPWLNAEQVREALAKPYQLRLA